MSVGVTIRWYGLYSHPPHQQHLPTKTPCVRPQEITLLQLVKWGFRMRELRVLKLRTENSETFHFRKWGFIAGASVHLASAAAWKAVLSSAVCWLMAPKDAHDLIPGIYHILYEKRNVAHVITLKIFRYDEYPELSGWTLNIMYSYKRQANGTTEEKGMRSHCWLWGWRKRHKPWCARRFHF